MTLPFLQSEIGCRIAGAERLELGDSNEPLAGMVTHPRLLPWMRVIRIPRFGRGMTPRALDRAFHRIRDVATRGRTLRIHLEPWSEAPEQLERIETLARRYGFAPSRRIQSPSRTLWIDLRPPEDAIFASFHATARRHIRTPGKRGYWVETVRDERSAPRIEELFRSSFERTGGTPPEVDWALAIRAQRCGAPLRIAALYGRTQDSTPRLFAFAMAVLNGEVAEYLHAGSCRNLPIAIPLLYAPTWALMRWARSSGAEAWDFGGISDDGARGSGIARFKRYFSRNEVTLGREWVCTASPFAARIDAIARGTTRLHPRGPSTWLSDGHARQ